MIIKTEILKGSVIESIELLTCEDSGSNQWMAYKLIVRTYDKGDLVMFGDHDMSPDLKINGIDVL